VPPPEPREQPALPLTFEGLGLEVGGKPLLVDVCCRIEAAGISVLLGPNGAGKSLWLGLAAGLREPSSGRVHWLGPGAAAGPRCAIVRQRPVLLRRSVRANLAYPLRLRGVPRDAARVRIDRALATARLAELAERPARSLLGGDQRWRRAPCSRRAALPRRAGACRPRRPLPSRPPYGRSPARAPRS
jgi:tungstate transport system ATP-binding protein